MGGYQGLKALGSAISRSMNTLTSNKTNKLAEEPPSKRQKIQAKVEPTPDISPYFPSQIRDRAPVSTQGGSQDDAFDLKSVSSTGNMNSTASATVLEFRHAKAPSSVKARVRKSRQNKELRSTGDPRSPSIRSINSDSPDVLSIDDLPPANITSDLNGRKNGKRPRGSSDLTDPWAPVKRPKAVTATEPIDVSEDELQASTALQRSSSKRKRTNFTDVDDNHQERIIDKGDIPSTKFGPSKSSNENAYKPNTHLSKNQDKEIVVKRAVAGTFTWEARPGQRPTLIPRSIRNGYPTSFDLDREDGDRKPITWLNIIIGRVKHIEHAATHSRFVVITRSTAPLHPPKLFLEFETVQDVMHLVSMVQTKMLVEVGDKTSLERHFHVAQERAEKRQAENREEQKIATNRQKSSISAASKPNQRLVVEIRAEPSKDKRPEDSRPPRREKLSERLARSAEDVESKYSKALEVHDIGPTSPVLRNTRRTRHSSPILAEPLFDLWTAKNPGWEKSWERPLVYPATGKDRTVVEVGDVPRLDEGEFLNDNIISFYLRYLHIQQANESPSLKNVYIFSSFFFEKLKSGTKYDGVKSWTTKIDLFSYDYIIVPVNEHTHWYLAIICNPSKALPPSQADKSSAQAPDDESKTKHPTASSNMPSVERGVESICLEDQEQVPRTTKASQISTPSSSADVSVTPKPKRSHSGIGHKLDPSEPRIITLDSLGKAHSPTCRILKEYLGEEAKHKKGVGLALNPPGMTGKGIPEQDNFWDCGVFVLGYMQAFLRDPDETIRKLLHKERVDWNIRPKQMRSQIRDLIFKLQSQQQEIRKKERELKRQAWIKQRESTQSAKPELPAVPRSSSQGPPVRTNAENLLSNRPADLSLPPPRDNGSDSHRPKILSSPAKIQQLGTPDVECQIEPVFIAQLADTPEDTTKAANVSGFPSKPPRRISHSTSDAKIHRPKLIDLIPSSEPDDAGSSKKIEEAVYASIEVSDGEEAKNLTPSKRKKRNKKKKTADEHTTAHFKVSKPYLGSETVSQHPRYHGIDRSVDLV